MKTMIALLLCLISMAASATGVTLKGVSGNSCEYTSASLQPDGSMVFECKGGYTGVVTFALGGPGTWQSTPICSGETHAIRFTKASDATVLRVWGNFFQRLHYQIFSVGPRITIPAGLGGYTFIPIAGAPNGELVVVFTPEFVGVAGYVPCNAVWVEVF